MPANERLFVAAEERSVPIVGEDGEERFLVRNLTPKRIGHADGTLLVRVEHRAAVALASDDVVDEHAAVHEIDSLAIREEAPGGPAGAGHDRRIFEISRVAYDSRHARGDEGIAEN